MVSPADLAECRRMIRSGSKTFYAASQLLPQRVCDASRSLYAFCRVADDMVDASSDAGAAVGHLMTRLDLIYAGQPHDEPPDRAFADVAARYAIPRQIPEALIEGFAWDASARRYQTLSDLTAYAVRVAGTVGVMMALIMEVRSPQAIARACDLGVAMQLTNIARDVGEDAWNGRLYLPRAWMAEAGLDADAFLDKPRPSPALAMVIKRLLAAADQLYGRSLSGIAMLPLRCRPSIHAARMLYAEIGHEVLRNGCDSVSQRAVVSSRRKLALLTRAVAGHFSAPSASDEPALPEAQFLIDAVLRATGQPEAYPRGMEARVQWLVELFTRLEKQQS